MLRVVKEIRAVVRSAVPGRALVLTRPLRDLMIRTIYRGQGVHCPICERSWRGFARFNGRGNARCPGCSSLERHRLLWLYLTRDTDLLTRPQRVLHLAPEHFLRPFLRSTHQDKYVYGDIADPEHRLDVTDVDFPDNSFDVIICSHVFEHVPDDKLAMAEMFRVLAPGGWAILDAPVKQGLDTTDEDLSVTSPKERRRRYGQWDHVRWYGRDYPDRLRAAGFTVELDPGQISDADLTRLGLRTSHDHIYLCRKDRSS